MADDGMKLQSPEMPGHHVMNAEATGADTAEAHIGDLSGELFPQHPKVGPWYSLAGDMAKPWELEVLESHSTGDTRHQAPAIAEEWQGTTIVTTGVTRGGTGADYNSDLPNH